jgi:gallate decarboxylase subunit D
MGETEQLPLRRCRVEDRAAGAWLEAACVGVGDDLVVVVGGGQRPHVGAAALAISVPGVVDPSARTCSSYLVSVPGHREEDLARDGALRLSRALRRQVVVTVGIHDDAISRERIELYLGLFRRLMDQVEAGQAAPPGG